MAKKKLKLELGCGEYKKKGFIGIDKVSFPGVDIVRDIEKGLPFSDNTVDEIFTFHTLEHIHDLCFVMQECWRILKPGGIFEIYVPVISTQGAFQDPTHVRFFCLESWTYFMKGHERLRFSKHYGFDCEGFEVIKVVKDGSGIFFRKSENKKKQLGKSYSKILNIKGAIIEATNICNYDCIMCPNSKQIREKGTMSMRTFKKIIDNVGKVDLIYFNGCGESLLDKNLIAKINYAREKYPTTLLRIHTNASLPINDLVDSPIDEVIISFYGYNAESYERIHKINNFEKVMKNIKKVPKEKITILCNYIEGMNDFIKVRELFKEYKFISFPIHTFAGGIDLEGKEKDCEISKRILVFLWNGDITTCCMDHDGINVFGNINRKSIDEIMEDLRKKGERPPLCKTCSLWKER